MISVICKSIEMIPTFSYTAHWDILLSDALFKLILLKQNVQGKLSLLSER